MDLKSRLGNGRGNGTLVHTKMWPKCSGKKGKQHEWTCGMALQGMAPHYNKVQQKAKNQIRCKKSWRRYFLWGFFSLC